MANNSSAHWASQELAVTSGLFGIKHDQIALDRTKLEDSAKLLVFADFGFLDANDLLGMERQDFASFAGLLSGEVTDARKIAPAIFANLLHGAATMPW